MTVRCLIVDDNAHFLEAACGMLEGEGIDVVGVASTSAAALRQIQELRPEVILVDIDLGEESGFDLASRLAGAGHERRCCVILTSTYAEEDFADLIAASPAVGFVSKTELSASAILEMLQRAAAGGEAGRS